ncbi:MAG TPA: C39 family peptidase, partial [Methanotrichaceae archaeon]|nr:C39 family peptidase [Methanotrichaceae archaeon]
CSCLGAKRLNRSIYGRRMTLFGAMLLTTVMIMSICETMAAEPDDQVDLNIPDRAWDPVYANFTVGWCGETSIQMAMAYFGREVSQKVINQAAGPDIPGIEENDVDTALTTLGVAFTSWPDSGQNVDGFIDWIKKELREGHPVICGTKIYPDVHPDWYVDHLVLAVGFDENGLILNTQTDCDGQQNVSYDQLESRNEGYSFKSNQNRYFGRAVTGLK